MTDLIVRGAASDLEAFPLALANLRAGQRAARSTSKAGAVDIDGRTRPPGASGPGGAHRINAAMYGAGSATA